MTEARFDFWYGVLVGLLAGIVLMGFASSVVIGG